VFVKIPKKRPWRCRSSRPGVVAIDPLRAVEGLSIRALASDKAAPAINTDRA